MFKKYIKILLLFIKMGLMRQINYRASFILAILGKVLRIGVILVFFQAIFLQVKEIGGWNFNEVLLLYATFTLIDFLISVTFHRNLIYYLPDKINKGEYDFRMIKPINLLFYSSFEAIDIMDSIGAVVAFFFLGYAFYNLDFVFNIWQIVLYILLVFVSLLFIYSFLIILASFNFWAVQKSGLGRLFESVIRFARYPTTIYKGVFSIVLIYIFPIAIIAQVPSETLLNKISPFYLFYTLIFTVILFIVAIYFWKYSIRKYSSASS